MRRNIFKIMIGTVLSLFLIGTASASAIEYGWPTDNHRITQYFKLYTTSTSKKHWGLDIGVNGENVYASADGEVYEVYKVSLQGTTRRPRNGLLTTNKG